MRARRRAAVTVALVMILAGVGAGWFGVRSLRSTESPSNAAPPANVAQEQPPADSRRNITLLAAGDVLPHPEMWDQARRDGGGSAMDFYPMFAHAAPAITSADFSICHLEPVVAPQGPYIGFPKFNVPSGIVDAVKKTGFDACSTASNHSLDQGEEGVYRTIDELNRVGLGHTGTFKSAEDALKPVIYDIKGVKVGHLSYSKSFNGIPVPPGKAWIANAIDQANLAAIIEAARRTREAGAQIVILSLHWGTEYLHEPDTDQLNVAEQLIASPEIDLILGHHAHVVQPVEKFTVPLEAGGTKDKWVIYGMGNQIARHLNPINSNREGVMMRIRFSEIEAGQWQVSWMEALPIWVDLNPDIRLINLSAALADPGVTQSRKTIYGAAIDRIHKHLISRGAQEADLKVAGVKSG